METMLRLSRVHLGTEARITFWDDFRQSLWYLRYEYRDDVCNYIGLSNTGGHRGSHMPPGIDKLLGTGMTDEGWWMQLQDLRAGNGMAEFGEADLVNNKRTHLYIHICVYRCACHSCISICIHAYVYVYVYAYVSVYAQVYIQT